MNKETVLALAEKGIEMTTPSDIIKDLMFLNFWVCRKTSPCWKVILKKQLVATD